VEVVDTESGAQESRFDHKPTLPTKNLRSCSKLARAIVSDGIVSDAESKPLRRPSAAIEKSCKRAKPL